MHSWIKNRQKFTIMVSICALYVVTISLAIGYRHASVTPWLILPLSLLHLYFYGIIHELTHNNIFARAKTNILVGHLLCPLNLVYFHAFKTIHLQHHRFAQIPVIDPVCTLTKHGTPFNPLWYLHCVAILCRPLVRAAYFSAPQPSAVVDALSDLYG